MRISTFLNFLFLLLIKYKTKHISIFIISTLLVFLLSSVMFISSSLQKEIFSTLNSQSDFVVQKINASKIVNTPNSWIDDFEEINAVTNLQQRVYGQYHFKASNQYFTIVGIDLFEESANKKINKLLKELNIASFLQKDSMIVSQEVKNIFDKFHYFENFEFKLFNNSIKKVKIFATLPKEANLRANDLIIMDISLAKEILNINEEESTDIVLNVPNELERSNVKTQLILKHSDIRIIQKEDIEKNYKNLFNYKGGFFLMFFIIILFTFVLILYQRYSMISSSERKEIGILRAVGWSIKDIIILKISETYLLAFLAFILGNIFAYIFVYLLNAPFLINIFLGFQNLENNVILNPNIDFSLLFMLFLFFIIPYISAVLIPVWKIAVIEPIESMK